jgi:hypothetical protein
MPLDPIVISPNVAAINHANFQYRYGDGEARHTESKLTPGHMAELGRIAKSDDGFIHGTEMLRIHGILESAYRPGPEGQTAFMTDEQGVKAAYASILNEYQAQAGANTIIPAIEVSDAAARVNGELARAFNSLESDFELDGVDLDKGYDAAGPLGGARDPSALEALANGFAGTFIGVSGMVSTATPVARAHYEMLVERHPNEVPPVQTTQQLPMER